jgi:GT2 family glycosyltransferase
MTSGVVIVAWNGERYLRDCLQSVLAQTTLPDEIVVVDNGSADNSMAIVREFKNQADRLRTSLRMVCNSRNLGFTRGANAGIKVLASSPSPVECVALLNQDAVLDPTWHETVQRRFQSDPAIGVVGTKIFHPNRLTIQHAGGYLDRPRMVGRHFGHHDSNESPVVHVEREVEFVTAAAMAVRTSALLQAGGFDEIFSPGYYEDVDLCVRLHEAGWKILFCPDAVATHVESGSFANRVHRLTVSNRARLIYALRWCTADDFRAEFARAERSYLDTELSTDERRALTAAYLEFLLMLPRALKARARETEISAAVTAALLQMVVDFREQIVSKKWSVL